MKAKIRETEIDSAAFKVLQEEYRELNMKFVNNYNLLSAKEYNNLMDRIAVLRSVIGSVQPNVIG